MKTEVLKISYSGETTNPLFIENKILNLNGTEFDLENEDYETIEDLATELNKLADTTAMVLNGGNKFESKKLNEISRFFPADLNKNFVILGWDNYASPKDICETFNIQFDSVLNRWLDNADDTITAQTNGFYFKEITKELILNTNRANTKINENYGVHSFFTDNFNELYLADFEPIQEVLELEIDGTEIDVSTVIIDYKRIILTNESEMQNIPVGKNKVKIKFSYGYPKNSEFGRMARTLSTYLVFENLYSYIESGTDFKPLSVKFDGLVLEEGGEERNDGVTTRMMIRTLFSGLPKKIAIGGV